MADAEAPEAPVTQVKGRGGLLYEILDEGLRVSTKGGLFKKATQHITAWDDFRRCVVETSCFSGSVTLSQADGDSVSIRVPLPLVKPVALAIYKHLNLGKHGEVDPKVNKLLGKRPKVLVFGSGLLMEKRKRCGSHSTFVPWEAVVSVSLTPGCFGSRINVKTLLEEEAPPSNGNEAKEASPEGNGETNGKEKNGKSGEHKADAEGPGYVEVNMKGKAEAMDTVFSALQTLMNGGQANSPVPDMDNVPGAKLTRLGLITSYKRVQHLLPWTSIAAVDLQSSLCRDSLVLTDCTGNETRLRKLVPGEFDAVRAQIAQAKGMVVGDASAKPIVRKNLRLTCDGLTLVTRHLCAATSQFIPWEKLDALEIRSSCFGGTLVLITETGERFPVWKAGMFGLKAMYEIASRIQDMKFGKCSHSQTRTFAGREGDRRACVLTNSSVKLVAGKGALVRILDLDSVNKCEVVKKRLIVTLRESIKIDGDEKKEGCQPLDVYLKRGDDGEDIARDMMRRAAERKKTA